jgi:hypothetical protein
MHRKSLHRHKKIILLLHKHRSLRAKGGELVIYLNYRACRAILEALQILTVIMGHETKEFTTNVPNAPTSCITEPTLSRRDPITGESHFTRSPMSMSRVNAIDAATPRARESHSVSRTAAYDVFRAGSWTGTKGN